MGEEWHNESIEQNVALNIFRMYQEPQQFVRPKMEKSLLVWALIVYFLVSIFKAIPNSLWKFGDLITKDK